jgi:hypothetical protein
MILRIHLLKPHRKINVFGVSHEDLKVVLAVVDFENLMSYGTRDSSKRWRKSEDVREVGDGISTASGVTAMAFTTVEFHAWGSGIFDGEFEDRKLEFHRKIEQSKCTFDRHLILNMSISKWTNH